MYLQRGEDAADGAHQRRAHDVRAKAIADGHAAKEREEVTHAVDGKRLPLNHASRAPSVAAHTRTAKGVGTWKDLGSKRTFQVVVFLCMYGTLHAQCTGSKYCT